MPNILIVPETGSDDVPERFKLRERISADDLGDAHICAQLLQRIGGPSRTPSARRSGRLGRDRRGHVNSSARTSSA